MEVDHLPLLVLASVDHGEPERRFLVANPESHTPINRPAHVAFFVGEWVTWNELDPCLALRHQGPAQTLHVRPPFIRVGAEKGHIDLSRNVAFQEGTISVTDGLGNSIRQVLQFQ